MSRNAHTLPRKLLTWLPLAAVATASAACSPHLTAPATSANLTREQPAATQLAQPPPAPPIMDDIVLAVYRAGATAAPATPPQPPRARRTPAATTPAATLPPASDAAAPIQLECRVGNGKAASYRPCSEAQSSS